jgi:hypothetical protein
MNKSVKNLPALWNALSAINHNHLTVQQDILETFIDHVQTATARRTDYHSDGKHARPSCASRTSPPATALQLQNSILMSLRHSDVLPKAIRLPRCVTISPSCGPRGSSPSFQTPAAINSSRRVSVCLVFLKLFERVYAPLTAGLLSPVAPDARIPDQKRSQPDRLYHLVIDDPDALVQAVGLKGAA